MKDRAAFPGVRAQPCLGVCVMAEVDPETLLEWLSLGQGEERDIQLLALEQLCMMLLISDNVDKCFEA